MRNRNYEERVRVVAPMWRVALGLMAIAAAMLPFQVIAQINTTTVQGIVFRADGTPATGTLLVSWSAFTTPQNQAVAAGTSSTTIGADGFVSLNLTPNANALPSGSYYTATYHLNDGTVNQEYWVIPASASASIATVRAQLEPSTVAVQPVSQAYVQSAISSLSGSWLPLTGGTLTGPLLLSGDPTASSQPATKHYADQLAAAQLPLAGGTLTGPLTVPNMFARQMEGRLYADQWQSTVGSNNGIAMSLSECASLPYACQVIAPALYSTIEPQPWGGSMQWIGNYFTQGPPASSTPSCTMDQRFGGPEYMCTGSPDPSWVEGHNRFGMGPSYTVMQTSGPQGLSGWDSPGLQVNKINYYGTRNSTAGVGDQVDSRALSIFDISDAPASNNAVETHLYANSNGDHIGYYAWVQSRGGLSAGDNEGNESARLSSMEAPDVYQGTLNSVTPVSTGTTPCTAPCSVLNVHQTQGTGGGLGDQLPVVDLTRAYSTGYIASIASNLVTAAASADWDTRFGTSTGIGTINTTIQNSSYPGYINGTNTFPQTNVVVPITTTSGNPSTSTPFCIFDQDGVSWECEPLTAASPTSVTLAVVTIPHSSGATWAQGGMTGMGFRMQVDCVGPGNLQGMGGSDAGIANTICPTYPIEFNTTGGVATIISGSRAGFSAGLTRGYNMMGSGGIVTTSVAGGVVTSCSASGGSGYGGWLGLGYLPNPPQLSFSVNSGATPPVLELTGYGTGGSLSGCNVVSGGSGITSVAVTVTGSNGYSVFPMARAQNVWNPNTGAVDGSSIAVDAGAGLSQFQVGDTIEQEHHYAIAMSGIVEHNVTYNGSVGTGWMASFGGYFGGNNYGSWMMNTNQPTLYSGYPAGATPWVLGQGMMGTPYGYTLSGSWRNGVYLKMPPYSSTSLTGALVVGCDDYVNGMNVCAKWNSPYNMILAENALNNGLGEDVLQYSIPTTTWSLTAGATGFGGATPYCTETLAGNAGGGFSVTCNGKTSKFDAFGNLSVPGVVRAQGVTGATINGEFTVDGTTYTTLNAAWNAAVSQANASGTNQTIRLGPGTFAVTATLTEPTNGACVSLIGSAAPTVTADSTNASTVINVPSSLNGDLFSLQNTGGSQAQSCTFSNLLVMANKYANHAFNFQWFRGLYVDDVTINDTTQDAFYLGEATGSHQANLEMRNVTVSYSSASFTPASRPNYGLNLQATVLDSFVQNLLVRNALQAAVYNAGGGTTFELVHGFGYPYTCTTAPCNNSTETNSSAADASWATNYEVIDTGSGGNMYFNTYMDSPAIAAFDLKTNGVQINGGHIQWPDTTSFPDATFAEVEATVSSNMVISNVDCLNMSGTAGIPGSPAGATGVWISYMGANGSAPSYSAISNLAGCGQYVQQRVAARQTAFDMSGNNSANTNYGSGQPGVTPKVFVTPLSSQANEGGVEVENFSGGQGDSFLSGFSGQASNFAVMADGTVRHTGLQTSAVFATSSTTLTKANHIVLANATPGGFTLTLPSCYTAMPDGLTPTGMELTIVKTDTTGNAVQLATSSSETIRVLGSTTSSYSLNTAGGLTLACGPDSNWYSTEQIAATATALAAPPSQCPAGYYSTGINANGTANCSQSWHFTWYGNFAGTFGTSTNSSLGSIWSPSAAINMTRLDIAVGTAPAGCSTYPVVGIYDGTSSTWLKSVTLATGTYSYRNAVTGIPVAAGHNLSMGVQTAGVGCTTSPGSAQLTMEYTMNQ
jgi:hypothetical protein